VENRRKMLKVRNTNSHMVIIDMGGYSIYIQPRSSELIAEDYRCLPDGVVLEPETNGKNLLTEEDKKTSLIEEVIEVSNPEEVEEVSEPEVILEAKTSKKRK
jgi:hypothetical protein